MHPADEVSLRAELASLPLSWGTGAVTFLRSPSSRDDGTGCIQFCRSRLYDSVMTEGRFALATNGFGLETELTSEQIQESEHIFKQLRAYIRKTYENKCVRWTNPTLPASPTNPSFPDPAVWLGASAMSWWLEDEARKLKQFRDGFVEAIPVPHRGG